MKLSDIVFELFLRYRKLDSEHRELIEKMFEKMREKCNEWPVDKVNRWIGFIQGILFAEGLIKVNEERDFTRPLFHSYYEANNIPIPKSVEL